MPDKKISRILDELSDIYSNISQICGYDCNITVDLGLVNKTNYYTGLVIKGYLAGHGDEVLSGGRYDKLISEFGYDIPAIGFAVNVDAAAKVNAKNTENLHPRCADAIVFGTPGRETQALIVAERMRNDGEIVENALFDDINAVREYAKEKKISKIIIVGEEDGSTEAVR